MCGIGLCVGEYELTNQTRELLRRRGPDFYCEEEIDGYRFYSSILSHQGDKLQPQPIASGDLVLLFNGEIYNNTFSEADSKWLVEKLSEFKWSPQTVFDFLIVKGDFFIFKDSKL